MKTLGYNEELLPNGMVGKSKMRQMTGITLYFTLFWIALNGIMSAGVYLKLLNMVEMKILGADDVPKLMLGIGGLDITLITMLLAAAYGGKIYQKGQETKKLDSETPVNEQAQ